VFAVADSYYSLFDLNGDDRPDLVFTSVRQSNGSITGSTPGAGTAAPHWNVHLNTGTGFSPTAQAWPVRSQAYHPATSFRGITHWATVDIDGDGKVDFLETSDPNVGGSPQPWGAITPTPFWKVYRNTGTGFTTTPLTWRVPSPSEVPESSSAQVFAVADSYYSLFDINGDDRPDLVFTSVRQSNGSITGSTPGAGTAAPHWNVHLNTGTGFSPTAQAWPVRSQAYHPATSFRGITYWATVDIDGDGKVDLVETSDPNVGGDPQPWGAISPTPSWKVYQNIGTGFSTTALTWRVPSPSEVPESSSAQVFAVADSYYSLFDLNGDDRPDLVFTSVRQSNGSITGSTPGAGTAAPHWNVHLNTGTGFSPTAQVWPVRSQDYHPATSFRDITYWATVDIDGDDKVDFLETSDPDVGGSPQPWGAITPTPFWNVYMAIP
jgi:hypothetical protein